MESKILIGALLLLVGVSLIFYGITRLNSLMSQLESAFGSPDTTAYAIIGAGVLSAIIGLFTIATKSEKDDA